MDFADALRVAGLRPRSIVADGKWRRCPTDDKPKKRNGAYVLSVGGRSGAFKNYALDQEWHQWRMDGAQPSRLEREEWRRRERLRAAEERRKHAKAASVAADMLARAVALTPRDGTRWRAGVPAHPYLARKGLHDAPYLDLDGVLLVPMRDRDTDALIGMQTIDRDGAKRYLPGSRAKGAVHRLGRGRELWLCEGYATGLSIRAGLAALYRQDQVVVCFSAGNLVEVASALRGRVIADHDASGAGRGAAERTGLPWAMPEEPGDANDLHQRGGIGAVRALLQRALAYRA